MANNFKQALQELTGFGEQEAAETAAVPQEEKEVVYKEPEYKPTAMDFEVKTDVKIENTMDFAAPVQAEADAVTCITSGMVIRGEVESTNDIISHGEVHGNVTTTGDITSYKKIAGDIKAGNLVLLGARVDGNVSLSGNMKVGEESILVGNIECKNIQVLGKIQGNLSIKESVVLQKKALVVGDITSTEFVSEPGTKIRGSVSAWEDEEIDVDKLFG